MILQYDKQGQSRSILKSNVVIKSLCMYFDLVSQFKPAGDQPQAIEKLIKSLKNNKKYQVLLGVTGSGKTFTMANVIKNFNRPTLIISHNKTLAAQLYQEFRDFFPNNRVCYFVSYYDYYQPEAYIPQSDTYIEKEAEINEEIDRLRLSATANLLTRPDTIVVASVSCIYNLGSPVEYGKFVLELKVGAKIDQKSISVRLSDLQYTRNDYDFQRGTFRTRGESIDILPSYLNNGIHIEILNDEIKSLSEFNPLTGAATGSQEGIIIYPAKHYMTDANIYRQVFAQIRQDLDKRVLELKNLNKLVEAQRLTQRTNFDLRMIQEVGYVNGIENYSTYFDGRLPGQPPYTLLDYFEKANPSYLCIIDESHITVPQIRGMYNGDRARKETLIDYGFRLPSAIDNRPLRFDEFIRKIHQTIFISATPDEFELSLAEKTGISEQLIRPTGLVDPQVIVKPTKGQIDDLINEIKKRVKRNERALVTTLTKRMAEDLSSFLKEQGLKVSYLHSDIDTLKRQDVLDNLRIGDVDVIIGINLLREGLDLPEVSLVAILDADKEGFLRSKTSLIQTMGRAARNLNAKVLLYADTITKSMEMAIAEVERRRKIQLMYNKKHHINPRSINKAIRAKLVEKQAEKTTIDFLLEMSRKEILLPNDKELLIKKLRSEMKRASQDLDFETAVIIRDQIKQLQAD